MDDVEYAFVEFGLDGEFDAQTPASVDGREFHATLFGLRGDSDYVARAVVMTADGELSSREAHFVTGATPPSLPEIEVTDDGGEVTEEQGLMFTSIVDESSTAVVIDTLGNLVWWHALDDKEGVISRSVLSRDGASVLYLFEHPSPDPTDTGTEIVRVALDGSDVESVPASGAHHDFVELPDGTLAVLRAEWGEVDGVEALGDRIDEISPDGEVKTVWSAFEDWSSTPADFDALEDHGGDWTHANALDYDAGRGAYVLSLRNLDTLLVIERASGDVLREIGGSKSDYLFSTTGARMFIWQHQFELDDDRLRIFDNGTPDEYGSRVAEYALDDEAGTATLEWTYQTTPPMYCMALGDVSTLPGDDLLVTWSTAGQIDRLDADGSLLWRLNLGFGGALGYTTWVESLDVQ